MPTFLTPLAWAYALGIALHRRFGFRSSITTRAHLLPLIVVGGLRAGGSGKTPVALELSRILSREGLRVGVMAYWLCKTDSNSVAGLKVLAPDLAEVSSQADWRNGSDEAVLLAQEKTIRVFVTRNRERAWDLLSRTHEFDLLVSDDGIMDPRLEQGALRLILRAPGENPGWNDLLPAGPFHRIHPASGDCSVLGPLSAPPESDLDGFWFSRNLDLPSDLGSKSCLAICGLGNPERFLQDLRAAGVNISGGVRGKNHRLPNPVQIRKWRETHGALQAVCSAKDWVKLAGREEYGPVAVVGERIRLGEGVHKRVRDYLHSRATS